MLVSSYEDQEYQCVDVKTDYNQFYLKFVKNCSAVTSTTRVPELDSEIRQLRHFWLNRISYNTSSVKKDEEAWESVTHHRIAQYCRLYT